MIGIATAPLASVLLCDPFFSCARFSFQNKFFWEKKLFVLRRSNRSALQTRVNAHATIWAISRKCKNVSNTRIKNANVWNENGISNIR
jgi:hypothetical protein